MLPFEFGHFANTVSSYLEEIQKDAQRGGQKMEFPGVVKQLDLLKENGDKYDACLKRLCSSPRSIPPG